MEVISVLEEIIQELSKYKEEKYRVDYLNDLKKKLDNSSDAQEKKEILSKIRRNCVGMGSLSDIDFWNRAKENETGFEANKRFHNLVEKLYQGANKEIELIDKNSINSLPGK